MRIHTPTSNKRTTYTCTQPLNCAALVIESRDKSQPTHCCCFFHWYLWTIATDCSVILLASSHTNYLFIIFDWGVLLLYTYIHANPQCCCGFYFVWYLNEILLRFLFLIHFDIFTLSLSLSPFPFQLNQLAIKQNAQLLIFNTSVNAIVILLFLFFLSLNFLFKWNGARFLWIIDMRDVKYSQIWLSTIEIAYKSQLDGDNNNKKSDTCFDIIECSSHAVSRCFNRTYIHANTHSRDC